MLPGEEIIHVLPQEYKVDSEGDSGTYRNARKEAGS